MARSMITMFGMSDRFGLMQLESIQNRYLDGNRVLNCSDETAAQVDAEVQKLLAQCYDKAKEIIRQHLDTMDKIAQFLIEKETITGKEFMKIYREVENIPEPTEEEQEKNKSHRIYATRPESALVGENVPVKKKEEKKAEFQEETSQSPKENLESGTTAAPEQGKTSEPASVPASEQGKTSEPASVPASEQDKTPEAEDTSDNSQDTPQDSSGNSGNTNTSGGLFSHVPDNFKN